MTYTCPNGCDVRPWATDDPCPLCQAPAEGLPEDAATCPTCNGYGHLIGSRGQTRGVCLTCNNGKRRPGRPLHSTDPTSRERRFRVVMTDTEHEALFAEARRRGVKVADLIRGIAPGQVK